MHTYMVTSVPMLRVSTLWISTWVLILGLAQSVQLGNGHPRVERFLLSALKDVTKAKYQQAIDLLNRELQSTGVDWSGMSEEQQDYFLAEWLIDGYEQGFGRSEYGSLLSALGRMYPRCKYKIAWKVFDVWGSLQPPQQAAAAPPELVTAMMVASFALNRYPLAIIICICYAGLLRVGEALQLKWKDVFVGAGGLTLCLGNTKRGMEQKVVITNTLVIQWFMRFQQITGWDDKEHLVFNMSYASVLRWVKKLASMLQADGISLTTHSFRRSGASELSRRGVPIADIMLFGRWLSDRSAREYIRKGEVAILRSNQLLGPAVRDVWLRWCKLVPHVWLLQKSLSPMDDPVNLTRVTTDSFGRLQSFLFAAFDVKL